MKAYFFKFLVQIYRCVPDVISSLEILQANKLNDFRVSQKLVAKIEVHFLIDVALGVVIVVS